MIDGFELPPVLDLIAAPGLHEAFLGRRGQEITINAAAVQRLGAQCLQILLAARAAWAADGQAMKVESPSDDFSAALELMGVTTGDLVNHAETEGKELA